MSYGDGGGGNAWRVCTHRRQFPNSSTSCVSANGSKSPENTDSDVRILSVKKVGY